MNIILVSDSLARSRSVTLSQTQVLLIALGILYFIAEYRLKWKADRRADRAEAREIEFHRRRTEDRE